MDELKSIQKILNKSVDYTSKKDWIYDELSEKDLEYELELDRKHMETEKEQFEKDLSNRDFEKEVLDDCKLSEVLHMLFTSTENQRGTLRFKQERENTFSFKRCGDVIEKIYLCVDKDEDFENLLSTTVDIECNGMLLFSDITIRQVVLQQMFYEEYIREDEERNQYQIPILNFEVMANSGNLIKGFPIVSLMFCYTSIILKPKDNIKFRPMECLIDYYFLQIDLRDKLITSTLSYIWPKTSLLHKTYIKGDEVTISNIYCMTKFLLVTFDKTPFTPTIIHASFEDGLDITEWDSEEILSVDIMDTRAFILPLCRDFNSWESIKTTFRDVDNRLLDGNMYNNKRDGKGILTINTDIEINTVISVYDYGFKELRVGEGTCNFRYCS